MKRSGPILRNTPLQAKSELKRTTALNAAPTARSQLHANQAEYRNQPKRPRNTGPTVKVRNLVHARSGGWCEWPGCILAAAHVHHRRPRRMGGSSDAATNHASNLLNLCPRCHDFAESHRAWAIESGALLHASANPTDVAVRLRYGLVLLADDGTYKEVSG